MKIIRSVSEMRAFSSRMEMTPVSKGFVATMGCLHEGHLSLVREARSENTLTIVSIFVNPAQFGPGEDFDKYPRDIDRDIGLLESENVDVLFIPDRQEIFPGGYSTYIDVGDNLTKKLCGLSRPGHFRGVSTIVAKLFNIVSPDIAYFGQKDFQQALIIKKMVVDLDMDVRIRVMPIVREPDGLAMSSRNKYLSHEDRFKAAAIFSSLGKAVEMVSLGRKRSNDIIKAIKNELLSRDGIKIDYIQIVDVDHLDPVDEVVGRALVVLAVYVGETRLIDNIIITGE